MNLISSDDINTPKIRVSPPYWILIIVWLIFILVFVVLINIPVHDIVIKYISVGILVIVFVGIIRNQFKGNYLVTLQASRDGLYFQTGDTNRYVHVPWNNIGIMEKAAFPLRKRGLRFEITGEIAEEIKNTDQIGNVRIENGRMFVYTIPQLHDRDRLIEQFLELKNNAT